MQDIGWLYREYRGFIEQVLFRFGLAADEIEDARQDVFLAAHRSLAQFERRSSVKTWLFAIARRVAFNYLNGRQRRRFQQAMAADVVSVGFLGDPYHAMARAEGVELLRTIVERMPVKLRQVFVLAELEELSGPEVATRLDLNLNTVYARLRAARALFDRSIFHFAVRTAREAGGVEQKKHLWVPFLSLDWKKIFPRASTLTAKQAVLGACVGMAVAGFFVVQATRHGESAVDVQSSKATRLPANVSAAIQRNVAPATEVASVLPTANQENTGDEVHANPAGVRKTEIIRQSSAKPTSRAATDELAEVVVEEPTVDPGASHRMTEETKLIEAAQFAVSSGHHEEGASFLEKHFTMFPNGFLAEEREVLTLEIACKADRRDEVYALQEKFVRQWPGSIHRERVVGGCLTFAKDD